MIGPAPAGAPPGPKREGAPVTTPGPASSTLLGSDTPHRTADHRQLPDVGVLAEQLRAEYGDERALTFANRLVVRLGSTADLSGSGFVWRVRWRASWWPTKWSTQTRYFSTLGHAERHARRLADHGLDVEFAGAARSNWTVTTPATFSTGRVR